MRDEVIRYVQLASTGEKKLQDMSAEKTRQVRHSVFAGKRGIKESDSADMGSVCGGQAKMTSLQSELETLKDTSLHQKKRVTDMMVSLLKDLSDIGTAIGGSAAENKVRETAHKRERV